MRISSPEFVGRRPQMDRLDAALERARRGETGVVLVGAEAGVGKTRLLQEHLARARDGGALVLSGGCIEVASGALPLAPVGEALRQLAAELGDDRFRALLVGPRRWLARLVPDLVATSDGAEDLPPAQVFGALHRVLDDLSSPERPVVLAMEDLHWADRSTLDLLAYLARTVTDAHLSIVGTYRSDELHRRHPLTPVLSELARLPGVDRLDLEPLTRDELDRLLTGIFGAPVPASTLDGIAERSGGNAFFAEELANTAGRADGQLPSSLRDVLRTRLHGLAPETVDVLRDAAVIGRRFSDAVLQQVRDEPVDAALREAIEGHVLVIDGATMAFRHALVHEATLDDTLPGRRVNVHAAVAAALRDRPELASGGTASAPATIAHHCFQAHDLPGAFHASVEAARAARAASAYAEAQFHGERALQLWDRVPAEDLGTLSRGRLLLDTAAAAAAADDESAAIEHARTAIRHAGPDDHELAVLARRELAGALWVNGRNTEALEAAEDALATAPPGASVARFQAQRYHAWMLSHVGRRNEALSEFRTTSKLAEELGDPSLRALALHGWGSALQDIDLDASLQAYDDAIALHLQLGEFDHAGHALGNRATTLLAAGRPADAVGPAERAVAIIDEHGIAKPAMDFAVLSGALAALRLGRWDDADVLLARVRRRRLVTANTIYLGTVGGQLAVGRGELRRARELIDEADTVSRPDFDAEFRIPLIAAGAELLLAEGHPADALARLEPHVDGDLFDDRTRLVAFAVHVAAAAADADEDSRPDLHERASRWIAQLQERLDAAPADSSVRLAAPFSLARARAELTRLEGRPDPHAWEPAIQHAVDLGERPLQAQLRLARAGALIEVEGGPSDAAAQELRTAASLADEIGARPLAADIRALARRVRIALPGAGDDEGGATPLTPREQEILALVADGMTNQAIAEQLFISPKTVSVHVSNLMRKLGAANRAEATSLAHRRGLLDGVQA